MKKAIKISIWIIIIFVVLIGMGGASLWYVWSSNLPYIGSLKEYNPPIITEIYSENGEVIGRFWDEKRIVISLEQTPRHLINAFIAAEDARFFKHEGVDVLSIVRAFSKNLMAGKIEQGGSTITQQVTKSLLLKNPEKTYKRKVREATLSIQIEKNFSKERILFLYLNQIYLGHGAYGVEAAARTYFNKKAIDLNLAEATLLAGLPQAPSRYSPMLHYDRARARQKYVLERMREEGYITPAEEQESLKTPVHLNKSEENPVGKAPYFTEHIRRYLETTYGRNMLYRGGLRVYTTVNLEMQYAAQQALKKGLLELDKREGYRGPLGSLTPQEIEILRKAPPVESSTGPLGAGAVVNGVVLHVHAEKDYVDVGIGTQTGILKLDEMKWARRPDPEIPYYETKVKTPGSVLKTGDLIQVRLKEAGPKPYDWELSLEQDPEIQGALLCMETDTGRIRSMVGGSDFSSSQFNRAIQARRQPGSAFKPVIYAAALDLGMNPGTIIIDSPYISKMEKDSDIWRPKNFKEKFFGPTLFRTALIQSMNVITVKILKQIGVRKVIDYARNLGIESDLSPDLSLALGSSGLSLLEITRAYSVFANGGKLVEPIFIDRIEDREGRVIEENHPSARDCISKDTAYVMTDLMKAVITEGTGWRIRELKRPAAGKTGTTNDLRDAWFLGFTPGLVAGVWVGYDDLKPMGVAETGSRAASPIWLYFMSKVLEKKPKTDFSAPETVVFAKIDAKTGLLASPYSEKTVFQAFKEGTEPKEYSPKPHTARAGGFSQFDMDFNP